MRTLFYLFPAILLLGTKSIIAQLDSPFQLFDESSITCGYFKDMSPGWLDLNQWSGIDVRPCSPGQGQQLYLELTESCMDQSQMISIGQLRDSVTADLASSMAIPLVIMDYKYENIIPSAFADGLIDTTGGIFTPLVNQSSLLEVGSMFTAFTFHDQFHSTSPAIILDQEYYFSNQPPADNIEIDFNDGNGFVAFNWGDIVPISSPSDIVMITLRMSRSGQIRYAQAATPKSKCSAPYMPDPSPWPSEDPNFPWMISADYNGTIVQANAYVKYREGGFGNLTKPFIFVEGIDFNSTDIYPDRFGSFGWCQFVSGTDPEYDFLYNMPNLIENLRQEGYDIILLDFKDGADYVQNNSEVLRKLIDLVNSYKTSDESNIVSGASMGGQITRYTLAKMEAEEVPHCTRLWISMDSPHLGAHIPLGLQHMLQFLADQGNADAQLMIDGSLQRPAARQMLIDQLQIISSLHEEWTAELEGLGYPNESRNIAIANGSKYGLAQQPYAGSAIIDYEVEFLGNPAAWLWAGTAPGIPYLFPPFNVVFSGKIPNGGTQLPDWLGGDCIPYDFVTDVALYPMGSIFPHESVPGSTRPTAKVIVDAINEILTADDCGAPLLEAEHDTHAFISTQSALGINYPNLFESVEEIIFYDNQALPFDDFSAPEYANERHSEISEQSLAFVLDEVLSGENQFIEELAPGMEQPGTFNFGSQQYVYFNNLSVGNGGLLLINALAPIHFAEDPDWVPQTGSLLEVRIGSCGSGLHLKNGAEMRIGNPDGSTFGKLIVSRDAFIAMDEGAKIIVHSGSSLVFESGSVMSHYGGQLIIEDGASVEFEPHTHIEFYGSANYNLEGDQSEIQISGTAHLNTNRIWTVDFNGSESQMVIMNDWELNLDQNAEIRLRSFNEDAFLNIAQNVVCNVMGSAAKFKMNDLNLRFHGNGELNVHASAWLNGIAVNTFNSNDEIQVFNKTIVNNSIIENVILRANFIGVSPAFLKVSGTEFYGFDKGLRVQGGSYHVLSSSFLDGAMLRSASLTATSALNGSIFDSGESGIPGPVYDPGKLGLEDVSLARLDISDCSFRGYSGSGIFKSQGKLFLKCTEIRDCHTGLFLLEMVRGYLDSGSGSGFNEIRNNRYNIRLEQAHSLILKNGFNVLTSFYDYNIAGSLSGYCNCQTSTWIDALRNTWQSGGLLSPPQAQHFDVWRLADCEYDPWQISCQIPVLDPHPSMQTCPGVIAADFGKNLDSNNAKYLIKPNPGNWPINISAELEISTLELWDLQGRLLYTSSAVLSNWIDLYPPGISASGVYLLRLYFVDGSDVTERIVIQ